MERLRKVRAPIRASFTRSYNQLVALMGEENTGQTTLEKTLAKLERVSKDLNLVDEQVRTFLLDNDCTDEEYSEEHDACEEYQDKLSAVRYDVDQLVRRLNIHANGNNRDEGSVDESSNNGTKKKFKLPKLEFIKFGGEIKEWLGFWNQFRKIHEDNDIEEADKFQYLIQATEKGSRARELVQSFPATRENYNKVIASLKARFGRDDLIVEVYVRELLRLVIQNASNRKERIPLSKLYDRLETHLRALESIGVTSEKYADMLFPLVESCLPDDCLRAWQRSALYGASLEEEKDQANPPRNRLVCLMTFLCNEVEGEERISLARTGFGQSHVSRDVSEVSEKKTERQSPLATATGLLNSDKLCEKRKSNCMFCDKPHESRECFQAPKMSWKKKQECLNNHRVCYVCLRSGHTARFCRANIRCTMCTKKHFAVMCPDLSFHQTAGETRQTTGSKQVSTEAALTNQGSNTGVMLQTVLVRVNGDFKQPTVRALIDTGSQRSYVLQSTARQIGLEVVAEEDIVHSLFGGITSEPSRHTCYKIRMSNIDNTYHCNFRVLDQKVICESIPRLDRKPILRELKQYDIQIGDTGEGCPPIEVLIGADVAGKLLTGQIRHLKSGLVAVETLLGWTVMGKLPGCNEQGLATMTTSMLVTGAALTDLWNLDTIGIRDAVENKTREELAVAAMNHFRRTVKFNEDQRYEVNLPWLEEHSELPSNFVLAEKRLHRTTKKLEEQLCRESYDAVFQDWVSQGIIEEVPNNEMEVSGHYLPHRAVFNKKSLTTPIRPVFDASARESRTSPSLNDCLERGPNLIELIPSVMMRFREKQIGLVADIKQAFLQISVTPRDRDFLRFLWWNKKGDMIVFRHRRVVFGVSSSPFLLAAVLRCHLERAPDFLQRTALQLVKSLYVDNCVTSVEDQGTLQLFIREATQLMHTGHFNLCGWEHTSLDKSEAVTGNTCTSVLGMEWNRQHDTLQCVIPEDTEETDLPITKRRILSVAHGIFDPVGVTCPSMLIPKVILQKSWSLKIGWDVALPNELEMEYVKWRKELCYLKDIKLPRHISDKGTTRSNWSVHTFCDASKVAYAAAVFVRIESPKGVIVKLLQAKSRVAPIKKITIPRLELLSCCIGTRLAESVRIWLELTEVPMWYWSDSTTALWWIKHPEPWGVFVANRVKEINEASNPVDWRHVPGSMNPADLPSRGCSPRQLVNSRWWEGPAWLGRPSKEWPVGNDRCDQEEVDKEKRKTVVSGLVVKREELWYLQYYSTFPRVLRMVAWMYRFIGNSRVPDQKFCGTLSTDELDFAERKLMKLVQEESFSGGKIGSLPPQSAYQDEEGLDFV